MEREHGSAALSSSLAATLLKISAFYPNIKALITVLCTLPVTSCSAERSFSGLKRVKSILRSSMTNERLLGLALLHMHQNVPTDIEEVHRGVFQAPSQATSTVNLRFSLLSESHFLVYTH